MNDVIEIVVDRDEAIQLLESKDDKDRGKVIDMIVEVSNQIVGEKMPEELERELRKYVSLPALQMFLAGVLAKEEGVVETARRMFMLDIMVIKHNYEETGLESVTPTKAS